MIPKASDEITYEILYYNHEKKETKVFIVDELDGNVVFKSADCEGFYDETTHTVTWKIEKAAAESYGKVQVTVEILESAYGTGKVENDAEVQIGNYSAVKANKVTTPGPIPDLTPTPGPDPKNPVGIGSESKNFKKTPMNDKVAAGETEINRGFYGEQLAAC